MQEEWRPIPGYEGHYEVSNLGGIMSLKRGRNPIRPAATNRSVGFVFTAYLNGSRESITVAQAVAMAFLDAPPLGDGWHTQHLKGTGTPDSADNIEWVRNVA